MIHINMKQNGLVIEGHANYAEHGRDIVCASVSAIAQTALIGLDMYAPIEATMNSGYLDIRVKQWTEEALAIYNTTKQALKEIEKQYPDYIIIMEG
jgi:uncharacterized protein YsxB (DUF464 family)